MPTSIILRLPEALKELLDQAAKKAGMSRNAYLLRSVEATVAGSSPHASEEAESKYPSETRKRSGKTVAVGSTPTADPTHPQRGPVTVPMTVDEMAQRYPGVVKAVDLPPIDCDHPKDQIRKLAWGNVCDACGMKL